MQYSLLHVVNSYMTKRIDFQLHLMILTSLSTHPFQADITRPHLKTKTVARVVKRDTAKEATIALLECVLH